MKTLQDAIGCWTVTPEYNALPVLTRDCVKSADACKRATLRKDNNPHRLEVELDVLRRRLVTTLELTVDAQRRLKQIIDTGELK